MNIFTQVLFSTLLVISSQAFCAHGAAGSQAPTADERTVFAATHPELDHAVTEALDRIPAMGAATAEEFLHRMVDMLIACVEHDELPACLLEHEACRARFEAALRGEAVAAAPVAEPLTYARFINRMGRVVCTLISAFAKKQADLALNADAPEAVLSRSALEGLSFAELSIGLKLLYSAQTHDRAPFFEAGSVRHTKHKAIYHALVKIVTRKPLRPYTAAEHSMPSVEQVHSATLSAFRSITLGRFCKRHCMTLAECIMADDFDAAPLQESAEYEREFRPHHGLTEQTDEEKFKLKTYYYLAWNVSRWVLFNMPEDLPAILWREDSHCKHLLIYLHLTKMLQLFKSATAEQFAARPELHTKFNAVMVAIRWLENETKDHFSLPEALDVEAAAPAVAGYGSASSGSGGASLH